MICKICGKEYPKLGYHLKSHNIDAKEYYDLYIKTPDEGNCPVCDKETEFRGITKGGYAKFNSRECANKFNASAISEKAKNRTTEEKKAIRIKVKQTLLANYGDENYSLFGSKRHQEAIRTKYGVDYVTQSEVIQEKSKQTCLEKYGCPYSFQSDNNKEKSKQTMLEVYGVENPFQLQSTIEKAHSKEAEAKRQATMHEKMDEIVQKRLKSTKITWANKSAKDKQELYNRIRNTKDAKIAQFELDNNCTHRVRLLEQYGQGWLSLKLPQIYDSSDNAYISNEYLTQIVEYSATTHGVFISQKEKELLNYVKSIYDGPIIENTKSIIAPLELDIYLPELKIAFEFNGTYWHSELQKDRFYHYNKSILCKEKGIRLIHIYEWEWDNNQSEIKELINEALANKFTIYGSDIVYCDFNKSNGTEYEQLGYSLIGYTEPNIWYWKDSNVSKELIEDYHAKIYGSGYLIYTKGGLL